MGVVWNADAREVSRSNPRAGVRRAHRQAFAVERLDDLGSQYGLELLCIRILAPQIAENIPTAARHCQLFAFHRNISFNLFKRSLIRSISRFGVLMPFVDFFWNACTTQTSANCSE